MCQNLVVRGSHLLGDQRSKIGECEKGIGVSRTTTKQQNNNSRGAGIFSEWGDGGGRGLDNSGCASELYETYSPGLALGDKP